MTVKVSSVALEGVLRRERDDLRGAVGVLHDDGERVEPAAVAVGGDHLDVVIVAGLAVRRRPVEDAGHRVERRARGQVLGRVGERVAVGVGGAQAKVRRWPSATIWSGTSGSDRGGVGVADHERDRLGWRWPGVPVPLPSSVTVKVAV